MNGNALVFASIIVGLAVADILVSLHRLLRGLLLRRRQHTITTIIISISIISMGHRNRHTTRGHPHHRHYEVFPSSQLHPRTRLRSSFEIYSTFYL